MPELDETPLWRHPLLACLTEAQQQWLSARISHRTIPSRSIIFQPEDPSHHLYFTLSGKVKICATSEKGSELIKKICVPGDFFGTKGLSGHPSHFEGAHTLRSETAVTILPIPDLHRIMEVNFDFAKRAMEMVWKEICYMEARTRILVELPAKQRFVKFLQEMTEREGSPDGSGWSFNSQLTQAEIGNFIGTGRQTVTEILNDFREKELLRYAWGRFFVQNIEGLAAG